jgi:hypothetical protein
MHRYQWQFLGSLMLAGMLGCIAACNRVKPETATQAGDESEATAAGKPNTPTPEQSHNATPSKAEPTTPKAELEFAKLEGRWVRPDGGYTITVKSVDADGKLDAVYANPNPLPFSMAEVSRDGEVIKLFDGRYGPYVKHGKVNASLPKGMEPDQITVEQAIELLAERAEKMKSGKGKAGSRKGGRKK